MISKFKIIEAIQYLKLGTYIQNLGLQSAISYVNVETCPNNTYSIGIFVIKANGCMPLHDHPKMKVCTRVLCGNGVIEHFNLVGQSDVQLSFPHRHHKYGLQSEKVQLQALPPLIVGPGDTSWTYPNQSNIHSIQNKGDGLLAFIDVLVPHYDFKERFCNFYRKSGDAYMITGFPEDFEVDNAGIAINLKEFI